MTEIISPGKGFFDVIVEVHFGEMEEKSCIRKGQNGRTIYIRILRK